MSESTILQITKTYVHALDVQDHATVESVLHDSFEHRFFPASLGPLAEKPKGKQEFLNHLKILDGKFPEGFKLEIVDTVETADTIVLHLRSGGKMYTGETYTNEYVFTVRFEGNKIISVREFMDSAYVLKQMEKLLA